MRALVFAAGLAFRDVSRAGRDGRARLVMMVGAVTVAVAILLAAAAVMPAMAARIGKTAGRGVAFDGDGVVHTTGVRANLSVGYWRGQQIKVLYVEVGDGIRAEPPMGVPRTPLPGEVFVSAALARALAGPGAAELSPRIPGTVVGAVDRGGLVGPDELYAVAGARPGQLDAAPGSRGDWAPRFARPEPGPQWMSQAAYTDGSGSRGESGPVDELIMVAGLAVFGLVVPLLVLIGTATRLSAATRERRLSAMRLVGASARQLRMFAAVEAGLVGVVGAGFGTVLFYALRTPVAGLLPIRDGLYAAEFAPPAEALLAVLAGVPVLAAGAGLLALRRAVTAPLSVRRQAGRAPSSVLLLTPLALGLLLLVGAYLDRRALLAGAWHGRGLLLGGAALCLIGLAIGAAALTRLAGELLCRYGRGLASQLAGRRLVADPAGAARALTGTALMVVLLGWAAALLPILVKPGKATDADGLTATLRPHTMVVTLKSHAELTTARSALQGVDGIGGTAAIRHVDLLPPGVRLADSYSADGAPTVGQQRVLGLVADCAELATVLRAPLPGCRPDEVQLIDSSWFDPAELAAVGRLQKLTTDFTTAGTAVTTTAGPVFGVPADVTSVTLPDALLNRRDGLVFDGDVLVPPPLMPAVDDWTPPTLLVSTDGRTATLEAIRTRLGAARTAYPPMTAEESVTLARAEQDGYITGAVLAALAVVLVGGLSLAVTTADGVRERHRANSALTAIGTPVTVLRRGVLLHTAAPLLLTVAVAVAVTATTSWLYLRLGADESTTVPPLPWAAYAAIGAVALGTCLLANVAALPFVQAATRPDALRTE